MTLMKNEERQALRQCVRMFYDCQDLRMKSSGRLQRKAEGAEAQLHADDLKRLELHIAELRASEDRAKKMVDEQLARCGFWRDVLAVERKNSDAWSGLAETLAAVILAEVDITRATTASKLWAYAGLAPVPAKRCAKCHAALKKEEVGERVTFKHPPNIKGVKCKSAGEILEDSEAYESGVAARKQKKVKLTYNGFLRAKLIGVLGANLLRANSPWRKFYDDYKNRDISAGRGMSDGHRHNRAIRYMVKMVLLEIWKKWREYEGLEVRPPYSEEYLGKKHHAEAA